MSKDFIGVNRYVFMQTETAIAHIASGIPVRTAIEQAVMVAMLDQAMICAMAGRIMAIKSGSRRIKDWYGEHCESFINRARPSVGVGGELPRASYEAILLSGVDAKNYIRRVGYVE